MLPPWSALPLHCTHLPINQPVPLRAPWSLAGTAQAAVLLGWLGSGWCCPPCLATHTCGEGKQQQRRLRAGHVSCNWRQWALCRMSTHASLAPIVWAAPLQDCGSSHVHRRWRLCSPARVGCAAAAPTASPAPAHSNRLSKFVQLSRSGDSNSPCMLGLPSCCKHASLPTLHPRKVFTLTTPCA